jgi:hypothetical protein
MLASGLALAQDVPASVQLRIDDCDASGLKLDEAYRAATLELTLTGARRVQINGGSEPTTAELLVTLHCERGLRATLKLRASGERSSASRVVPLDDATEKDRSRVLALAVAEFVRSEWGELASSAATAASPASPAANAPTAPGSAAPSTQEAPSVDKTASPAYKPASEHSSSRDTGADRAERAPATGATFEAAGRLRWFAAYPRGIMLGGGGGLRLGRWSADAEAVFGNNTAELGSASFGLAAGVVGFEALRLEAGRAHVALVPAAALGATWVTGTTTHSQVEVANQTNVYLDGRLSLRGELRLQSFSIGALLDAGRAGGIAALEHGQTIGATGGWFLGTAIVLGHR